MSPGSTRPRKRVRLTGEKGNARSAAETLSLARAADSTADGLGEPAVALALDELLTSVRPRRSDRDAAGVALKLIREALVGPDGLGSGKERTVSGDSKACQAFLSDENGPGFVGNAKDVSFKLAAPDDVAVVGGYMLGHGISPVTADLAIEMPSDMFQSRDYLNYRYHDKRLLYLVQVALLLRKSHSDAFQDLSLSSAGGLLDDPRKPVLSVTPVASPNVSIRVTATIGADVFDSTKLAPTRGNVRPAGTSSTDAPASPAYNASIIVDTLLVRHTTTLHRVVSTTSAFSDAALMLRLWSRRRSLADSGFVAAAVLAHTIASGSAPALASKEHLFRAALGCVRSGALSTLSVDGFKISTGWDNSLLGRWRREAAAALVALDAPGAASDAWGGVIPFLFCTARGNIPRPVPSVCVFDAFVTLRGVADEKLESRASLSPSLIEEVGKVLSRALVVDTQRAVSIEHLKRGVFGVGFHPPDFERGAYRKVDLRPAAADVGDFKEFWGPKAEVRRFKDGKIVECLVWEGGPGVVSEIVHCVVARHFKGKFTADVALGQLEEIAAPSRIKEETSRSIAVFNELSSLLRKVKGLPLAIKTVLAVSPMLRRCAVQSARPNKKSKFVEAIDILAVFENSAAWPDDVLAMASAKAAFYVALKTGLAELGVASRPTVSFLDILVDSFVFRLRVRVDKEASISGIEKDVKERLIWETQSRVALHDALRSVASPVFGDVARVLKRWLSAHLLLAEFGSRGEELVELIVARLFAIHHGGEPRSVLSGFCQCLHILSEFPWEAAPLVVPLNFASAGLMEGDESVAADSGSEIGGLFDDALEGFRNRQANGLMDSGGVGRPAVALCSSYDRTGSWFSGKGTGPERVILKRASMAASSALQFVERQIFGTQEARTAEKGSSPSSWEALFRTPESSFQHTIVLNQSWAPRGGSTSEGPFASSRPVHRLRLDSIVVGLDPVERLAAMLKEVHGNHAIFLYDKFGGSRIFMAWRPSSGVQTEFSVKMLPFMTPLPKQGCLVPDKDGILSNVKRLGGVMIKRIE